MPRRLVRLALFLPALLLGACAGQLEESRFPTGSNVLATSSDFGITYAVDTDAGEVVIVPSEGDITRVAVGLEPTRIARAGERLFVSLRGERHVAVLDIEDGGVTLHSKIAVGAEPIGVVADEDGERVYVVASLAGEVHEIDAGTTEIVRSWTVRDEPRWLALHPSGRSLYVGSFLGGVISRIDLDEESAVQRRFLPEVTSVHLETFEPITLSARVTGDPAVSPNGKVLAIPGLYVDNVTPVSPPNLVSEDEGIDDDIPEDGGAGYGGGPLSRFNPTVVLFPLDPHGDFPVGDPVAIDLTASGPNFEVVRSYPSAVAFTPSGDSVLATMEGASAVVSIDVEEPGPSSGAMDALLGDVDGGEMMAEFAGPNLTFRRTRLWTAAPGPRGLVFTENERAQVYSFLGRELADIDVPRSNLQADSAVGSKDPVLVDPAPADREDEGVSEGMMDDELPINVDVSFPTVSRVLGEESLPADIAEGRRLFYAADDSHMAAAGSGVSCSTCHFDGRNDGLTWRFDSHTTLDDVVERQTPSLAGVVSMTAPVTWTDNVATVAEEVTITSEGRMGGSGIGVAGALKVASFIDWTREPDVPLAGSTSASVLRGRAIFEREDVGCSDCHSGAAYTDNESYDMYGIEGVRTRSLVGIAASAPYLHDGSAPTLEAVLISARDGEMGDTGSLNDQEMEDLANYLKSL